MRGVRSCPLFCPVALNIFYLRATNVISINDIPLLQIMAELEMYGITNQLTVVILNMGSLIYSLVLSKCAFLVKVDCPHHHVYLIQMAIDIHISVSEFVSSKECFFTNEKPLSDGWQDCLRTYKSDLKYANKDNICE